MVPEQREALDEIIVKMQAGRMTRRTFIERAVALGLTMSAAGTLLEACGSSGSSTINITWESEHDPSGTYAKLVENFNKTNKDGIHVTYVGGPDKTDQMRAKFITELRARNGSTDVMSMDVIWPAEWGSNQWTVPLDDKWPASDRQNYLPGPLQSCTYNGKIWAAPLRTDAGLLYYRTDLISTPPSTWDDLTNMANAAKSKGVKYGYVWQGAQYEGLVCDFVEVLEGYGGHILDPNDPSKVTVNSPEGVAALTKMASWVNTISPAAVTTYAEEDARTTWQNGDSAFMRNWPYAYSLGNDASKSKVAGKFDIHTLLYGGSNTVGHSCTGGWNLGINAFSKNPDAAWKFVQYMLSPDAQKLSAKEASVFATLLSVYDDPEVLQAQPFFAKVKPVFATAVPRPGTPKYPDVTLAIQKHIHDAITGQSKPADALKALADDLTSIISK